jgi:thiamine-monophosphate kinase
MVGEALFSTDIRRQLILQGGDDYELCFTAHPKAREAISSIAQSLGLNLQRIGRIVTIDSSYVTSLLHLQTTTGQTIEIASHAYEHFE